MSNPLRVTVDDGDETETALVSDATGSVSAGDVTVTVSVGGDDESEATDSETTDGDTTDGDTTHGDTTDGDTTHGDTTDDEATLIVALDVVPTDSTIRFEAHREDHGVDCILRRIDDAVVAWQNACPHEPDVPLDRGSGAIVRGDDLVCHRHGAQFAGGEGVCTYGPCAGDVLDSIDVTVRDGAVYLTDERFTSAGVFGQ